MKTETVTIYKCGFCNASFGTNKEGALHCEKSHTCEHENVRHGRLTEYCADCGIYLGRISFENLNPGEDTTVFELLKRNFPHLYKRT